MRAHATGSHDTAGRCSYVVVVRLKGEQVCSTSNNDDHSSSSSLRSIPIPIVAMASCACSPAARTGAQYDAGLPDAYRKNSTTHSEEPPQTVDDNTPAAAAADELSTSTSSSSSSLQSDSTWASATTTSSSAYGPSFPSRRGLPLFDDDDDDNEETLDLDLDRALRWLTLLNERQPAARLRPTCETRANPLESTLSDASLWHPLCQQQHQEQQQHGCSEHRPNRPHRRSRSSPTPPPSSLTAAQTSLRALLTGEPVSAAAAPPNHQRLCPRECALRLKSRPDADAEEDVRASVMLQTMCTSTLACQKQQRRQQQASAADDDDDEREPTRGRRSRQSPSSTRRALTPSIKPTAEILDNNMADLLPNRWICNSDQFRQLACEQAMMQLGKITRPLKTRVALNRTRRHPRLRKPARPTFLSNVVHL